MALWADMVSGGAGAFGQDRLRGRARERADVVDHVRLVVVAELHGGARPALAAAGGEQCLHAADARELARAVAGGGHEPPPQVALAVAGLAREAFQVGLLQGRGGERIGTVGVAHRVEQSARADDVGQRDAHVRQLVRRDAVQRGEGTGTQAHAGGLVARLEPREQHRAQRADDVAADDVHAAVGRDAQRRGAHAAQAPEGLDPGSEVAAGSALGVLARRRRRGRSPAAWEARRLTRRGFYGRHVRFFQGGRARRA